jgi:Iron/manganese superoxide dismutases, C-terminal domain
MRAGARFQQPRGLRTQFVAMAKALAGGSGWAILAWSERLGRLVNHWAADHSHALPSSTPILAIDMYEHAYHLDFGARAAAYVDQVMANLNWERIGARYHRAVGERTDEDELFLPYGAPAQREARISTEELKAALEESEDRRPVLLDLCQPRDLPRRTDMLAGATMHAPAAPAIMDRGFAARPADCGLLYLRFPGQQHGRNRTAAERLRRQGSRRRHYGAALQSAERPCRWIPPPTRGRRNSFEANYDAARDCPGDPAAPLQMDTNHPSADQHLLRSDSWMIGAF